MTWHGIYAITLTPFNRDHSIDWHGLHANAAWLAEQPVDVVVVLGSEGEFYALTDDERRAVVAAVVQSVAGRRPVVAGVSHPSAHIAGQFARHAAASGCDGVMTAGPYYSKADGRGLREHVEAVAACGLPVVVYNVPARVGYNLTVDQIIALTDIPGVTAVKQGSPDIAELADLLARGPDGVKIVGGAEIHIWPALAVGAHGNTATAASALPGYFAELWRCAREGDLEQGRSLYQQLAPLRRAYEVSGGQVPVVKRLLELVGLAGGLPRPPLRRIEPEVDRVLQGVVARFADYGEGAT